MEIYADGEDATAEVVVLNERAKIGQQLPRKTPTRSPGRAGLAAISPNAMGARKSGSGSTTKKKKKLGMKTAMPRKSTAESSPPVSKEPADTVPVDDEDLTVYLPTCAPSPPPTESLTLSTPQQNASSDPETEILPTDLSRISFGGMISSLQSELNSTQPAEAPQPLQPDIEELKRELVAAKARAETLALREMELESAVSGLEQQIDETVQEMEEQHQTEIDELTGKWENEKDAHQQQIKQLRDEIVANEGLSALVSRNDDMMKQQESAWQKKLEQTQQELKEVSARLEDADGQRESLQRKIEGLESKNCEMQAQGARDQGTLEAANQALQHDIEVLKGELEKSAANKACTEELSNQLTEMEKVHSAAVNDLRAAHEDAITATRNELQEKVVQAEKKLCETVAELENQHREKVKAMEAELAAATSAAVDAAAVTLAATKASIGADDLGLMGEFETVESVLATGDELREVNKKLSLTIEQRDAEVSELQSTADALTDQLSSATSNLQACQAERDEAVNKGASATQHAAELESKLSDATAKLDETTQKLRQVEDRLDQAVAEAEQSHNAQLETVKQELSNAQLQLANANEKVAGLTEESAELQEALKRAQGSFEKAQCYTQEQRQRIEELGEQSVTQKEQVERAQSEKAELEQLVAGLQRDVDAGQSEAAESKEKLHDLQNEMSALREEVERQRSVVADGEAAMERCDELEEKVQLLNTELVRAQTQMRRSTQKATDCEKKMSEINRTLNSTQRALAVAEERANDNETRFREEQAAREAAENAEADADSRRAQAEFEQQLVAGEKAQMMQKLDMLLTTRGEPIDTIKLVRTQTELEVEVRKLKETVSRTNEQLVAAKREAEAAKAHEAEVRAELAEGVGRIIDDAVE